MIAIINYGLGNLRSVAGAVEHLGFESLITNKLDELKAADKLILPGVGAFGDGIKNLRNFGLIDPLSRMVKDDGKPVLGICLGFQLLAKESYEFGHHQGLDWIDAKVLKINTYEKLRIPHVGWNDLFQIKQSILFDGIPKGALFYYVHSFYAQCTNKDIVIGECEYGSRLTAAIEYKNIFGTQFHPEKSQKWGLKLLKNFLEKA